MTAILCERIQHLAETKQWEQCLDALQYVRREEKSDDFHRVALAAYEQMQQEPEYTQHVRVLRGMACTYYDNIWLKQSPIGDKERCRQLAKQYFREVFAIEREPYDVYRYGRVLTAPVMDSREERYRSANEAVHVYRELAQFLERRKPKDEKLYSRVCYQLCRCILLSLRQKSVLEEEISLLFPQKQDVDPKQRILFLEACKYMDRVRSNAGLPRQIRSAQEIPVKETPFHYGADIYYTLGKVLDTGGQHHLCNPSQACKNAARYYRYACRLGNLQGQSVTPFVTALATLYVRMKKEGEFQRLLAQPVYAGQMPEESKLLFAVRWHILHGAYDAAKRDLAVLCDCGRAVSASRKQALTHIIHALEGSYEKTLPSGLKPWQACLLHHVSRQRQR